MSPAAAALVFNMKVTDYSVRGSHNTDHEDARNWLLALEGVLSRLMESGTYD
jgi:hypothetical protein